MAKKQPMTQDEKDDFIKFLTQATPEELTEFIKNNGKINYTNDRLFVFQWDALKKDN
jgi:hypothetical protein